MVEIKSDDKEPQKYKITNDKKLRPKIETIWQKDKICTKLYVKHPALPYGFIRANIHSQITQDKANKIFDKFCLCLK